MASIPPTISISDDDLCSTCARCSYNPGELSACSVDFPAIRDADGYITKCGQYLQAAGSAEKAPDQMPTFRATCTPGPRATGFADPMKAINFGASEVWASAAHKKDYLKTLKETGRVEWAYGFSSVLIELETN